MYLSPTIKNKLIDVIIGKIGTYLLQLQDF